MLMVVMVVVIVVCYVDSDNAFLLMVLVVCLFSMRWFLRVTEVPKSIIVPVVLVCCVIGVFALNNRVTDVYLLLGVGVFAYFCHHGLHNARRM